MAIFLKRLLGLRIKGPSLKQVFATISILGLGALCFILGTAVMHFRLPPSEQLRDAFQGAQAWQERGRIGDAKRTLLESPPTNGITIDIPAKTDDGFTLYTTTSGSWAALIDMKGNLVHEWHLPFKEAHSHMSNVRYPLPDLQVHWFGCRLFPNGDLLAVYQADGDTPTGYGLVKLDRNSKLLWAYAGRVHHDFDVGEDGSIYALEQKLASVAPAGMAFLGTPYVADYLVVLSPEGKELYPPIPLLEAFRDSKFASTLQLHVTDVLRFRKSGFERTPFTKGDFLHPNAARVLGPRLAPQFPLFKMGQVLISLRNIDTLALLDIPSRFVVWAALGAWRRQHAPEFLANGHLLLYDNLGVKQTRVLEYDPVSQAIPWDYSNENSTAFQAISRGSAQRLANGNTLIVDPDRCRIFEVTASKEVVWESYCLEPAVKEVPAPKFAANITSAWRYRADQLKFLKEGTRARP